MNLADLRRDYRKASLNREDLPADPLDLFRKWLSEAENAEVPEPNAMVLATVDEEGQPFTRTVLLKKLDARGLVFFTNFDSRKSRHLQSNPRAAVTFLWLDLERQVNITGTTERVSNAEAFAYFATRPLASRLGAWTSRQSEVIQSRSLLEAKWQQMKTRFADGEVPLPSFWGGYRIQPTSYEFWQGRRSRLHDRFLYSRSAVAQKDSPWELVRLQP